MTTDGAEAAIGGTPAVSSMGEDPTLIPSSADAPTTPTPPTDAGNPFPSEFQSSKSSLKDQEHSSKTSSKTSKKSYTNYDHLFRSEELWNSSQRDDGEGGGTTKVADQVKNAGGILGSLHLGNEKTLQRWNTLEKWNKLGVRVSKFVMLSWFPPSCFRICMLSDSQLVVVPDLWRVFGHMGKGIKNAILPQKFGTLLGQYGVFSTGLFVVVVMITTTGER